jgi:hypothetical protein
MERIEHASVNKAWALTIWRFLNISALINFVMKLILKTEKNLLEEAT